MTQPRLALLIAEDEPLASMALRAQLEALGHHVIASARDGDEAVLLGQCLPVDVAVFDMRMPGPTGLDAARELFGLAPTPVVLLTGFSGADLPHPVPRPPVFATLTKPIGLDQLGTALTHAHHDFLRWARTQDAADAHRQSLDDRRIIARALDQLRQERSHAAAAREFLDRARLEQRSLVDLARDLLHAEA